MRKVITVNLNGIACQIEEPGYEALQAYLAEAAARLTGNPDRAEILSDLEQAIADRCAALLGPHRNVVGAEDLRAVLAQMGPVEAGTSEGGVAGDATAGGSAGPAIATRRLYRLPAEGMPLGICAGLAAWLGVDVVWVRIGTIVLTLLTSGGALLLYFLMIFVMPRADTPERVAQAHGTPSSAQEVIQRVKKKFTVNPAA